MRPGVLILAIGVALAEEPRSVLGEKPPALLEALARLGKMKSLPAAGAPRRVDAAPAPGPCSVPLAQKMPEGTFASQLVRGKETAPMPQVKVPARACGI